MQAFRHAGLHPRKDARQLAILPALKHAVTHPCQRACMRTGKNFPVRTNSIRFGGKRAANLI